MNEWVFISHLYKKKKKKEQQQRWSTIKETSPGTSMKNTVDKNHHVVLFYKSLFS